MMANFSDSLHKAQTVSICQFCEESSIEWKCINCNLFLCQLCNSRIHSKITLSNKHHVINLSDCGSEDAVEASRKVDLDKLTCTLHSEQKCVLYCKNCERSVCSDCLVKDHKNHDFCKLDKVYDEKLKIIKDTRHKIESDIPHFREKEEDLQKMLTEGNKQYSENRQKIIKIKDNIVKYADGLLSDLDKQWKPTEDQINTELTSVRQRKDGLEQRKSQLDQTLSSSSASGIFITSNSLDKSMLDKTVKNIEIKRRKFIPGRLSNKPTSDLFGKLYDIPILQLVQNYKLETPFPGSDFKLIKCDENDAFMGNISVLLNITLEKDKFTIKRRVELPVYDMTLMDNGDLLISSMKQDLKLYTQDGQLKTYKSFAPLDTLGIHVSKQNEIFVGLSDDSGYRITNDNEGKVVQINQKGVILHTYEYDTDNQRLFTWPAKICSNNKYIYVVDYLNYVNYVFDGQARVVGINKGGQLKWIYNGSFDKFYPSDIAVTSTDMVIVTDSINHALHVLSPTGELIICKVVTDIGIIRPYSLSIDKNNKLWIRTLNSDMIHALKLT